MQVPRASLRTASPVGVAIAISRPQPPASLRLCHRHRHCRRHTHSVAPQAIGSGSEGARSLLQERYNRSMSLADASALVVRVLTETMEDKVTPGNVEVACVVPGGGVKVLPKAELEALIARAAADSAAEGR